MHTTDQNPAATTTTPTPRPRADAPPKKGPPIIELRATTQAELDAILARDDLNYHDFEIVIDSPRGVWICEHTTQPQWKQVSTSPSTSSLRESPSRGRPDRHDGEVSE